MLSGQSRSSQRCFTAAKPAAKGRQTSSLTRSASSLTPVTTLLASPFLLGLIQHTLTPPLNFSATMGFFSSKKDKSAIPLPPNELARSQPSTGGVASSGRQEAQSARDQLFGSGPSSGGASQRTPSIAPSYATQDPYGSGRSAPAPSRQPARPEVDRARLAQESDPTRAALFAGYNPDALPKSDQRRQYSSDPYGPAGTGGGEGGSGGGGTEQDEEEEVEMIKRDIRGVKQETLGSSRNALRIAREAEETARGTLSKLGDQSGAFRSLIKRQTTCRSRAVRVGAVHRSRLTPCRPSSSLQSASPIPSATSTCLRRRAREPMIRRTSSST